MPEPARQAFILGNYKSGSTWLLQMLSLHPEIRGVSETHIFHQLHKTPDFPACTHKLFHDVPFSAGGPEKYLGYRAAQLAAPIAKRWRPVLSFRPEERPATLLDLPRAVQAKLERDLNASPTREAYCRTFFDTLAAALKPGRYLLEKSTGAAAYVPFAHDAFPDAKMLIIYRDGRDVVVSSRYFVEYHLKHEQEAFRNHVLKWRAEIEMQLKYGKSHGVFTCSYEALKADDRTVLKEILDYLGLPASSAVMDDMLRRSSFKFLTGRDPGQERRSGFIRKGIVGEHRSAFSDEEKRIFKELAGDLLIELGYERDNDW